MGDVFRQTAGAMEKAGLDFFLVETMSDVNEAALAIAAIKDVSSRPVVATMAFSTGAKGPRTMMGTTPEDAATGLAAAGADLIGTNCCSGIDEAVAIMTGMLEVTPIALIAQPNAGLPVFESGQTVYPETPEAMAAGAPKLLACGVRIIGGCCGTTPAHIEKMGSAIGKG
jgi:5-methyltetrahydrofolate--homocysteine methyltransferase